MESLLASIGVTPATVTDELDDVVNAELDRRGHRATMVALRYGVLTLQATDPLAARQLSYDVDDIRDAVNARLSDAQVTRVVVRSAPM